MPMRGSTLAEARWPQRARPATALEDLCSRPVKLEQAAGLDFLHAHDGPQAAYLRLERPVHAGLQAPDRDPQHPAIAAPLPPLTPPQSPRRHYPFHVVQD